MISTRIRGLFVGILSSATFGLIPLFTLPISQKGISYEQILFYRFLFAAIAIGIFHRATGGRFRLSRHDVLPLFILGFLYSGTALFLFHGYTYMASGVATTIHFLYPLFVSALMAIFFREKLSFIPLTAMLLALVGVGLLMGIIGSGNHVSLTGFIIVAISALSYALYIIFVNKSHIRTMPGRRLTFYIFVIATIFCFFNIFITQGSIKKLPDWQSWGNILLLALVPTVISNLTLVIAVRNIGSTLTSALGAMEPLTSVLVGVIVFGEVLQPSAAIGIVSILIAVALLIFSAPLETKLKRSVSPFLRKRRN